MSARRDIDHVTVSADEWQSLNARLRDAEEKLRALQASASHSPPPEPPKSDFIAKVVHELRNPLAPIRSAVEIMRLIGQKDTALRTALDLIARQVDRLSRVVDDLLDMSQLRQGKVSLNIAAVDVNSVLWRAVEIVQPLVDERMHSLVVAPLAQPATVDGEQVRLVQIVSNLLDNAAKYTEPGGTITLSAQIANGVVEVSVADTGKGIAPDLLPHVFDLFESTQNSGDRAPSGLGIGLAVVRNLVSMHGGTVEARSAGPRTGSVFTVRLPLSQAVSAAQVPLRRDAGREMPRRIVVIDDNEDAAESLAMLLRLKGHDVQIAYGGEAGVALALESTPDCVLVDIGLPDIDGFEVAKRLRSRDPNGSTLLVALTGYGQAEDRTRSRQAGFDHHLVKPVSQGVLENLLRER
jgi:two-component system CheB/CheR fusion protein